MCMTKNKKPKNNPNPLPKPDKAKGPVTLGRSTFTDDIINKVESHPSVGSRKVASRQPTGSFRATGSPYVAFAEVHNKIEETEQSFQEIKNSRPISLQEGNSSNLYEGGGEIREEEKPRSPEAIIQPGTLSIPDKGSAIKFIEEEAGEIEEPRSPQGVVQQGTIIVPD